MKATGGGREKTWKAYFLTWNVYENRDTWRRIEGMVMIWAKSQSLENRAVTRRDLDANREGPC
jgi:hypothetical protein